MFPLFLSSMKWKPTPLRVGDEIWRLGIQMEVSGQFQA
jgi:hypothetical protein